jgi:hypothetical protein
MKNLSNLKFSLLLLMATALLATTATAAEYKVTKTWKLGGDGGWDYLTADSDGHRLFIARATRVMVIDTESGKQVGEIPIPPACTVSPSIQARDAASPAMGEKTWSAFSISRRWR